MSATWSSALKIVALRAMKWFIPAMSPNVEDKPGAGEPGDHDSAVIAATRHWVDAAVIGLNLCPFAHAPRTGNRIRYCVSAACTPEDLARDLAIELRLLAEATSDHPRILKDPPAAPRLMSFEDYGMRLEVRFWIRDPMNGVNNVRSDVNRRIFQLFREHGITIPVAQREIRIVDPDAMLTRSAPRADDDADTRG